MESARNISRHVRGASDIIPLYEVRESDSINSGPQKWVYVVLTESSGAEVELDGELRRSFPYFAAEGEFPHQHAGYTAGEHL